ncbi:hypothetical protein MKX03_025894 [Papaver bracteatum]|nr:hypothetical protein MKX03_025894 [Papaver bracteatum]
MCPTIKEGLGEEIRANAERQIAQGLPIDATILFSEMPLGFEYNYVLKMEARYNWNKGKGNFIATAAAEARGEIA